MKSHKPSLINLRPEANRARTLFKLYTERNAEPMTAYESMLFDFLVELGREYDENFKIIHQYHHKSPKPKACIKALEIEEKMNRLSISVRKALNIDIPVDGSNQKSPFSERHGNGKGNISRSIGQRICWAKECAREEEQRLRQDNGRVRQLYKSEQYDWLNRTASLCDDGISEGSPSQRVNRWKEYCKRTANGQSAGLDGVHDTLEDMAAVEPVSTGAL